MIPIIRKNEPKPPRIVLYGGAGIGKTTFGASAEKPVFILTEDGLGQLEVDHFPLATSYLDVMKHVSRWLHATAPAVGFGWWGALVWSVALAAHARRHEPAVTIARLAQAAWIAAGLTVTGGVAGRLLGVRLGWRVLVGVVLGSLAARAWMARR